MMHPPAREDRKRRFSEMEQVYGGPEDFMEAGVRGFLITSQADKEEFALDDSLELLRQASIMIYGGYTTRRKKPLVSNGYVKINFMDPGDVQILPRPEGEPESEDEVEEPKKEKTAEETENQEEGEGETKDEGEKGEEQEGDEMKEEKEEAEEMEEDQGKGEEGEEKPEKDKKRGDDDKSKDKRKDRKKGKKDGEKEKTYTYMRCQHKFKAFRTELRNTLFIKSNVPDPLELASAAMDLVLKRRAVNGDALSQLVPVQGVCNYDFNEIEIMTRRILRSIFDENLPPKSYNVMLFDKISEPGSEQIAETVRNTIWGMNPNCWLTSVLTEPDALIRVDLIGSKVVLSCMTNFMMYRQYSPYLLSSLGPGCPEDDDGTDMNDEMKREHEEYLQRKKEAEERRQREEEERKRMAAEKRVLDEERRVKKLEDKKRREEERQRREEENKKKREERKKKEEERRKAKEEEKAKAAAEKAKEETKTEEGESEVKEEVGEAEDANSSQNQAMDDSTASQEESAVEAEAEAASDSEPKAKRGRRGRGRGKAKK